MGAALVLGHAFDDVVDLVPLDQVGECGVPLVVRLRVVVQNSHDEERVRAGFGAEPIGDQSLNGLRLSLPPGPAFRAALHHGFEVGHEHGQRGSLGCLNVDFQAIARK